MSFGGFPCFAPPGGDAENEGGDREEENGGHREEDEAS